MIDYRPNAQGINYFNQSVNQMPMYNQLNSIQGSHIGNYSEGASSSDEYLKKIPQKTQQEIKYQLLI